MSRVGERRGRAAEREGEDGWRFADGRPGETGGEGKRGDGREGGRKWEGSAGAVARWRGLHGSGSLASGLSGLVARTELELRTSQNFKLNWFCH